MIDGPNNPASPNEIEKIDAFNDLLRNDGHWVTAAGIVGPERATLIDNRGEKGEVQSASLFNSKEYYSGFWLIEAGSAEEARRLALAGSQACNRKVELRSYIQ